MKVLDRQQIGLPRIEPLLRCAGLALRTMPVAATVVGDLAVPAVGATFIWPPRSAVLQLRTASMTLSVKAQMTGITLAINVAVVPENVRHLQHE